MKIPDRYKAEYRSRLAELTRGRVVLFCALSFGIYFLAALISYLLAPQEFSRAEIPLWVIMILGGAAINYLNRSYKTLKNARLSAYLFAMLLLLVLTRVNIIYGDYIYMSSESYLFLLFLVSFTIPWRAIDVLPITLMHMAAFTLLFAYSVKVPSPGTGAHMSVQQYVDGIIFLFMGSLLCFALRKSETSRDIHNFLLLKEVEEKSDQMQKELELATRIHKTLIPKSISTDKVDIAVTYLPMYYMGGDYAKFHLIDEDKLIFIICDVTGHGVSAALFVNRFHTEFERLAREKTEPGALLKALDEFIKRDFEGLSMYMSAFCGLLDFSREKLAYSNHGHPAQYIYRITDSDVIPLKSHAALLGLPLDNEEIQQHEIGFKKGDKLLLFTDGVIETKSPAGEFYGEERLEDFIRRNRSLYAERFNKDLLQDLGDFRHGDFEDDIFMLSIHIRG